MTFSTFVYYFYFFPQNQNIYVVIYLDWFLFLLKLLKHVIDYKIVIILSNFMLFIYYLWMYYKCISVMKLQMNRLYLFFSLHFYYIYNNYYNFMD